MNYRTIIKELTILYVEDENEIRDNITRTLKLFSSHVISTSTAIEALEIYKNSSIDFILSDISMPDMNGLEFVQRIRHHNKTIPIVLLTAHTTTDFLLQATRLKLTDYLQKPINLKILEEVLQKVAQEIIDNGNYSITFKEGATYNPYKKILLNAEQQEIKLTSRELELLEYFLKRKNHVISSEELKQVLWQDEESATTSALKNLISRLRNKISKQSITNISGMGYKLTI